MIVLWRITERCNFACGFCAFDRRVQRSRRDVDAGVALRVGAQLGAVARGLGEPVLLSWLGGEPLLWKPVFDVSRRLRRDHGLKLSATTNGSTLHRADVIDGVLDSFTELTVSVDGSEATHDHVRGRPGAWQRVREGVRTLARARHERGVRLVLRTNVVLMRATLAEFDALCDALATWGIDEITFNPLGGRDRPEFFPANGLRAQDSAALRALLGPLQARLAARGVRVCANAPYLDRIDTVARGVPIAVADCAPGERLLFIDEAGHVSPCSFTTHEYGVHVDDLRDASDWLALPQHWRRARTEHRAAACDDCRATHVFQKFARAGAIAPVARVATLEPSR